ncbi:MAG: hypothetical protein ACK4WC_13135 [Rubrimonas sp.]
MDMLILYLALALLVAWFASSRGRSGLLAFLLAVVFSPLLVFIGYLIAGRSESAIRAQIEAEERMRAEVRARIAQEGGGPWTPAPADDASPSAAPPPPPVPPVRRSRD